KGREEFAVRLLQNFGLVENQNGRFGIIEERGLHRLNDRHQIRSARKELAIVGKDQLLVQILFERFIAPSLARPAAPRAKHFTTDHDILHRKNVDMLERTAGTLIVEIEFANRVDAVTEEFDTDRIPHEW